MRGWGLRLGKLCEHMFVSSEANVLHADLDSFYASVEQRDAPHLRGRPVIVGSWVVLAASYEAKRYGVQGGMGGSEARRRCPQAVIVRPRMAAYSEASKAVFEIFERTSPVVEPLSIDEAFLDARGMEEVFGTPEEIAVRLRREVRREVGLPITVGVAVTKFLAKVASAVAKPDGLLVVPPGGELAFLHPLPVERLWGVGPVTSRKLRAAGITTVRQVAESDEEALVELLGRAAGRHIYALAHNRDPRRVRAAGERTMGAQRALGRARRSRPRRSTPPSSRSSTASPAGCARPGASAARSRCGCASTTSRARRARTRCRRRPRRPRPSSPPRASCSRRRRR